ncbi:MAG: 2-phospho-L-lactate guanylyltransferase [Candidatus Limnocylindrales bacterium]
MPERRLADLAHLHVIVPVRALADGKRRLSPVLGPEVREALIGGLLRRTLEVVATWGCADAIHVVSPDPAVMPIARAAGGRPLLQADAGLNEGILAACGIAAGQGATAILILPGDLPVLEVTSLEALLEAADAALAAGAGQPVVIVAPADARSGTNALLLSPPDAIAPGFGPGSLERHLRAAEAAGASTQLVVDAALGFDLDTPDDLALLGAERLAGLLAPASAATS